jgi:tetratricopeptide (TPR) repeat protein
MELAFNRYQAANYTEAATDWEHALKLEPDNLDALESLGGVYHMLDRNDDAAAVLQRALEIKPDADTFTNLGTIRFYQGRYKKAIPFLENAVSLNANRYDSWSNLADAYRWAPGHSEKAKQAYQQAIQLVREEIAKAPNQADLRANLAMYLAKNGDRDGALKELTLLDQSKKKDAAVLYTIAVAYEVCREREKALDALEAAVKAGQSMADLKSEPEFAALRADPRYHLRILNANPPKP